MKAFLLSFAAIAVIAFVLQMFLPWWIIAIVGFAIGFFVRQRSALAFFAGFLAIFLLWSIYAFLLSGANNHLLAGKVALLLPLKGNIWVLLLITGLIGGLVTGFATLSGRLTAAIAGR